ncbi:MAG TPA: hypothetical protein VLG50_08210 [Candidatus Saccharimonadales bacterium]|nr:hypothetical protein [Candidatus Saccharimonadales bacterium]
MLKFWLIRQLPFLDDIKTYMINRFIRPQYKIISSIPIDVLNQYPFDTPFQHRGVDYIKRYNNSILLTRMSIYINITFRYQDQNTIVYVNNIDVLSNGFHITTEKINHKGYIDDIYDINTKILCYTF